MRARPPIAPLLGVPAVVVALDQASKWLVLERLTEQASVPVVPGLFNLTLIHNPGAAFGLFAGASDGLRGGFLVAVSVLAVGLLAVFYLRSRAGEHVGRLAAALVIGGALGNLIDRLRFGQVVDFLDVYVGRYHWPAFNVADSAITVGIALFLWSTWRERHAAAPAPTPPAAEPVAEPLSSTAKEGGEAP